MDDAGVLEAHQQTGYMPYWGYLWPTSLEMAAAVLQHEWPPESEALEIGMAPVLATVAAAESVTVALAVSVPDFPGLHPASRTRQKIDTIVFIKGRFFFTKMDFDLLHITLAK